MNEKIFDKIMKVLWLIVVCVAINVYYNTYSRFEVVSVKGKTVYRFDKVKGIYAKGMVKSPNDIYFQYDKDGYRYTISFQVPDNDGSIQGMQDALKERDKKVKNWKASNPNSWEIQTPQFEDLIK